MISEAKKETVAIVGGGMAGIAAAFDLAGYDRFEVVLLEKARELGGLSSYYQWQDLTCDRFYHVILSSDRRLIEFIGEIGLRTGLEWTSARTGFFGEGRLLSLSSLADYLTFPFLTFPQKVRMGAGILRSARIKDPSGLEAATAKGWLTGIFGARVYENIWEPLLWSKLGAAGEAAPATFIWGTIKRLYGARSLFRKREMLGHVRGGYHRILGAARKKLQELGVRIRTSSMVERIIPGAADEKTTVITSSGTLSCDRILLTIPSPEIYRILDPGPRNEDLRSLRDVAYLGITCVLLILKRRLTPYYVINLLDKALPFTGIVESTNAFSVEEFGGRHLVYVPKYCLENDELWGRDDAEVIRAFLEGLTSVVGDFRETDVLHAAVFRERHVQPVYFAKRGPSPPRSHVLLPNIYLGNSTFIGGAPLNNEAILRTARAAAKRLAGESAGA
jgi:protoporphyrinogen oxidase